MNGTCAAAFAEDGPTCWNCPFRAVAASLPPEAAVSKYGLLICLGRKAIVSELLVALGVLPAEELLPPPPQAVRVKMVRTMSPRLSVENSFFTVSLLYIC